MKVGYLRFRNDLPFTKTLTRYTKAQYFLYLRSNSNTSGPFFAFSSASTQTGNIYQGNHTSRTLSAPPRAYIDKSKSPCLLHLAVPLYHRLHDHVSLRPSIPQLWMRYRRSGPIGGQNVHSATTSPVAATNYTSCPVVTKCTSPVRRDH